MAQREIGEVAGVAGEARKAEQGRPVIAAGIVAIMQAKAVANDEIAVAASFVGCDLIRPAHDARPSRRRRLVASATCLASALDQTE